MRDFSAFDPIVYQQLWLLEQQADTVPMGGADQLQVMAEHVAMLVAMLPPSLRDLVPTHACAVGFACATHSEAACHTAWRHITADLRMGLDRIEAARASLLATADALAERPVTVGEHVLALCRQGHRTGFDVALAQRIEHLGAGDGLAGEARELGRALARKRRTAAHEADLKRRVGRIEAQARLLHHR
jgi:hypothetical protein